MTTLKAFNASERMGAQLAARARQLYETTRGQLGVALVDTGLTTFGMLAGSAATPPNAPAWSDSELESLMITWPTMVLIVLW
jgi:hypothetical protein